MRFFSKTLDKLKGALKKTAEVLNTDVRTLFVPGRQIDDAFLDEMEEKFIRADIGVARAGKLKAEVREQWRLGRIRNGESIRVFPLSNWTELDVWLYIHLEKIPVVPLYFAAPRPVVDRDGMLIMVDDDRMPLKDGETPRMETVRFRSLGCYPLSGAMRSNAADLTAVIEEMLVTRTSERQSRAIDFDQAAAMEKRKREGYF